MPSGLLVWCRRVIRLHARVSLGGSTWGPFASTLYRVISISCRLSQVVDEVD